MNNIIQNAEKANVIAFIDSPVYVDGYKQSIRLHERYPNKIFVTLGIPPANYHELDILQSQLSLSCHKIAIYELRG